MPEGGPKLALRGADLYSLYNECHLSGSMIDYIIDLYRMHINSTTSPKAFPAEHHYFQSLEYLDAKRITEFIKRKNGVPNANIAIWRKPTIIPLNIGNDEIGHWVLVSVNHNSLRGMVYNSDEDSPHATEEKGKTIRPWVEHVAAQFFENPEFQFVHDVLPKLQKDNHSCGIWTILFARALMKDGEVDQERIKTLKPGGADIRELLFTKIKSGKWGDDDLATL